PTQHTTLFPYTTLFRSANTATTRQLPRFTRVTIAAAVIVIILGSSEQARVQGWAYEATQGVPDAPRCRGSAAGESRRDGGRRPRSEEHTSELQSRFDLV